ncbi:MAG: hypothetical protein KI790_11620 [Cyclobacteriaceae bacterium]|nr:hypothetical protein [Cyclobacteriaceae bacterium HetDA_MAG_MS6]
MQDYLLIIKGKKVLDYSPEELQRRLEEFKVWAEKMGEKYVAGQRLEDIGMYIKDEKTVISDGPFLEAKEIIAGYVIIKSDSLDRAAEEALQCPLIKYFEVYVRPMIPQGS